MMRRVMLLFPRVLIAILIGGTYVAAAAPEGRPEMLAKKILDSAQLDRGLCCVVGGQGQVALRIAQSSRFFVHALVNDEAAAKQLRNEAERAGFGIDRLLVERAESRRLPHADGVVDLVVDTVEAPETLRSLPLGEILRVLRPEGKAILIGEKGVETRLIEKPALQGADEWTHWEHAPDNNPVSTDQIIKPPYMTQFLAEPFHITMPSITTVAGGKTFLATGHIAHHQRVWEMTGKLIARNGYNGIILWERDLPEGYMAHRSAFIATKETFHMIDGNGCLMLDPETGEEKGRFTIPGVDGEWKWMAMLDGVLYVMAGEKGGEAKPIKGDRNFGGWSWADLSEGYYSRPRVPWGFGDTIAAYQLDTKRVLWRHGEDAPIDSRALAIGGGGVFLYCPDKHVRRLEADTGNISWTNANKDVLRLIEQPGRNLISTPGFRSSCIAVATPDALVIQGQTRMQVVALATKDGRMLWNKQKITNNPNAIYLDGTVIAGIGRPNSHLALNPLTGEEIAKYDFRKAACARLTACPGSLFVRGEGVLRYDLATDKVLVDGAARPGCNDGVIAANGLLYIGPWACDCNLSLIGAMAKCSAGDFRVEQASAEKNRLWRASESADKPAPFDIATDDWPTFRANVARSGSTPVRVARPEAADDDAPATRGSSWTFTPSRSFIPTPPVSAGGMVFVAGDDGKVRALDGRTGKPRWEFATDGPILAPPTIWEGRAYVGGGDGRVHALEAATGRALWRFRAAPIERKIMVYGKLSSTWPVNTGVLVSEGTAYFAAGIIDYDGTCVYALDARTGEVKWRNDTSGFLNAELRKGVSAQGCLTIRGGELLMAGGNQVSPARFDIKNGKCLNQNILRGFPSANHGRLSGVLFAKYPIVGGRTLYSSRVNVANKDSFVIFTDRRTETLNFGGVPPAWDGDALALVNYRDGKLQCRDAEKMKARIEASSAQTGVSDRRGWVSLTDGAAGDDSVRWTSDLDQSSEFEIVAIALCQDAAVALGKSQNRNRAHAEWWLAAFDKRNGAPYWFWRHTLPSSPLPEGLAIDREGKAIVALLDGRILRFEPQRPRQTTR